MVFIGQVREISEVFVISHVDGKHKFTDDVFIMVKRDGKY